MFILLHSSVVLFWNSAPESFLLDADSISYAEVFQYVKYVLGIALLAHLIKVKKIYAYLPVLALFILLFADDLFQLHYKFGFLLAYVLNLFALFGYKAMHVGLLLYTLLIGLLFFGVSLTYYKKATLEVRRTLINISILLIVFFFFGVVVDFLHFFLLKQYGIAAFLRLVEEGGEMLSLSLLVGYFLFLNSAPSSIFR